MAYGPVNLNLGTTQTVGGTNTGTVYTDPKFRTWLASAPGAGNRTAGQNWQAYQSSLSTPAAGAAPAAGTPSTPLTAPIGGLNAGNMSDWASIAGQTAASLADPFAEQRPQYQQQLSKLMSDPGSLATSPLYKFALDQGLEAVNRTAGARGLLGSGTRLAELTKLGTGLAGENFFKMAPLLGRFAGADTSSPAAAGTAYAYGQGKAMDAFSNQEMERAYRDAMGQGGTQYQRPGVTYPTSPLAAPLSGGPAPLSQPGTYSSSYFPPPQSTVYPSASEYSLYGGAPSGPTGPMDFGSDYGPGETPGTTQYGGDYGPGDSPVSIDQSMGLDYNPDVGAGGAMDMGAGYSPETLAMLGLGPQESSGFGVDTGMEWTGALPQLSFPRPTTLSPINATMPPPDPNQQDLWGDWGFMGARG